jgi:site-specific DNA-methyltransferase (adenine-specific)
MLSELGFVFKEEIIWNKLRITSPLTPIGRKHETISIHSLSGKINKTKVPFIEKYKNDNKKIIDTINRIASTFGNRETFSLLKNYYEKADLIYTKSVDGYCVTRSRGSCVNINRTIQFARGLEEGIVEQSIIDESADHYATIHPTEKPVRLLERLLQLVSKEGDLILDPFAGSFSTAETCINLNRDFKGWEIDEEYFNAGKNRILELPKTLFNVQEIKIKL